MFLLSAEKKSTTTIAQLIGCNDQTVRIQEWEAKDVVE
jgi:hypothetical protein